MKQLKRTSVVDIDGKTFTIQALSFEESLELLPVVHKVMTVYNTELNQEGLFIYAVVQGILDAAEIDKIIKVMAKKTTVDMNDGTEVVVDEELVVRPGRTLLMRNDAERSKALNEVFGGQLELMFPWLDACFELNFKGTMGKMRGAVDHLGNLIEKKMASKAEPKSE